MLATEFIQDKRFRKEHKREHIQEFISGYVAGEIPDYQVAAWLMAVCLNGMTPEESFHLTDVMLRSGKTLNWNLNSHFLPTDKHSTGGIGDKTSLVIAPLVASFGIPVPMMAGRGLGFTGGTLDKLESIPGFQTRISMAQFEKQMATLGMALMGQTEDICPADRKMYSLRDVTGTVESVPLICASILSKKIAEGAKALVMDVKFGSGAFMGDKTSARVLAQALIDTSRVGGLKTSALLTDMNQPLGRFVGNSLEVFECLEILKNRGFDPQTFESLRAGKALSALEKDYSETAFLSLELSAYMLVASGFEIDLNKARHLCLQNLQNGAALKKFEEMVMAQGGSLKDFTHGTKSHRAFTADHDGFFSVTSNKDFGLGLVWLGGGRQKSTDALDLNVGLEFCVRHGDPVKKGQKLFEVHYNEEARLKSAETYLLKAFKLESTQPTHFPLIAEVLN